MTQNIKFRLADAEIFRLRNGNVDIPVTIRGETGPHLPVVMLHGLQSHSGWFVQSSLALAAAGHPTFAFDRRGSGQSTEKPGDCVSFQEMIDDIAAVTDEACARRQCDSVHVVAHCFGAIPAVFYCALNPSKVRSLTLASPALAVRVRPPLKERIRIFVSVITGCDAYASIPFREEMLSDDAEWIKFAQEDPHALRRITGRCYMQIFLAQLRLQRKMSKVECPVLMLLSGDDPINDNKRNRDLFKEFPSEEKQLIVYPKAKHILEFSEERDSFLDHMVGWLALQEPAFGRRE